MEGFDTSKYRHPNKGDFTVHAIDGKDSEVISRHETRADAQKMVDTLHEPMGRKANAFHVRELGKTVKEETMQAQIKTMLEKVIADDLVESKDTFDSIISQKVIVKLYEAKIKTAQSLFGIKEAKNDEDDEDDEHSAETSDEAFTTHPIRQLQHIADYKPNTEEEDLEYTASGAPDKRSLAALAARKAKGGSTAGLPKYKHANGEESEISPEHAQHLVHTFTSSAVKPETKKKAIDMLHGSKEGLDKISKAVGTGVVQNKSIYHDPRV